MFAELNITSNFSFLKGASHPEEYMSRAAALGMEAVAIADENSVAGIVRAHARAREIVRQVRERQNWEAAHGRIGPDLPEGLAARHVSPTLYATPRLIPAARLVFEDGCDVTALPETRHGWGSLCRLLSSGKLRADKGSCDLQLADFVEWGEGLQLILWPQRQGRLRGAGDWVQTAHHLTRRFAGKIHVGLSPQYDGRDSLRFADVTEEARRMGLPTIASASPLMHHGSRRKLADVVTAIRSGCRVDDLGREALPNSEARLRSETEMRRLFSGFEGAVDRAYSFSQSLKFSLDELRYEYPSEITRNETPSERLRRLAYEGLAWRYPAGAPEKAQRLLEHELTLIAKLKYEPYFLTVRDIVAFARSRDILCQGRGSAANSVVCYCLGVTSVSPEIGTMVFERFVSEARDEPPDIDVDFEHERREEVIQHIYERYGRHRAGLCATVVHYRGKRAIREVGRAMGLTEDTISAMSSQLWGFFLDQRDRGRTHGRDRAGCKGSPTAADAGFGL